jgi:hypothetical protein
MFGIGVGLLGSVVTQAASGSAGFNPLSLFSSGQQGLWLQASDNAQMWQDSAGTTPVTAVTQPIGKDLDKSGNGYSFLQATSANRPAWQTDGSGHYYLGFDQIAQYMAVTGGTFGTNMTVLMAAQRTGQTIPLFKGQTLTSFIFCAQSGSALTTYAGSGAPATYVNGTVLSSQTRGALDTAWPINTMAILEASAFDMTAWAGSFDVGLWAGTYPGLSKCGGIILVDGTGLSTASLNAARTWLGAQNGLTV